MEEGEDRSPGEGEATRHYSQICDNGLLTLGQQKQEDVRLAEERANIKWQKEHMYDDLHTDENMEASNNQDRDSNFEDDFM